MSDNGDDLALFATPNRRPRKRSTAAVAAGAAWTDECLSAIQELARTGRTFEAFDVVRDYQVAEPPHFNMWGRVFQVAQRLGIIEKVAPAPSSRRTVCGSLTWTWRGSTQWRSSDLLPAVR